MPFVDKYDEIKQGDDRLLTPGEVADLFGASPDTVGQWASKGKIGYVLTPGGQRRYFEKEVRAMTGQRDG